MSEERTPLFIVTTMFTTTCQNEEWVGGPAVAFGIGLACCDVHQHEPSKVDLTAPIEAAADIIAFITVNAEHRGLGSALTSLVDQALAKTRQHVKEHHS